MASPLLWISEQARYLLRGPGSNTSTQQLISIPPPPPTLRTSVVFDSHIQESNGVTKGKNPQTISSAWDERRQWSNEASRSWQGLTAQDRKLIMLDIYLNNPWISACIDVISKRICSGGFTVEKVDEELKDNQAHLDTLNEFLLRINPDWDFLQLARSLITSELIFGESYAELTVKNGIPWQLFPVDTIPMGYVANRYGQIERFYQQMDSNMQKNWLEPDNIIRWWFPHPRASVDPFAPAEKVTDAVLIDKKMMTWMQTFFQKGAKFPYHVEGAADQDEADRLQTWFLQNVMGAKNAHKMPVTWGNAKIVPTGNAGALEMDFQKGREAMRTIVFAAFGVPPAAVSIIESGNIGSGTGEDQDKSLIFNACDPVKQAFLEKLNFRITKGGFNILDYRIGLRYADYRSDESVSKVEDTRIKNGSRTVDEIRLESGKKPYKQGGSVPFIWSTKEIVPLPRLDDLENEQRQTAQVTLDTAKAGADLAKTKAKQAKEPPPVQPPAMPGQPLQKGQQPVTQNATANQQKQAQAKESIQQLSLLDKEAWDAYQEIKPQLAGVSAMLANESENHSQNTGAMVALMIPPEIGKQIAIAGGEPVEDLHITLAFLGEASSITAQVPVLRQALQLFASTSQPLSGKIAGLGRFDGPEDEASPVIALPDIPGLPEFRQALAGILATCGTPANAQHGYTPHITLAYIDGAVSMPITTIPHLDLSFDSICLAVGDERTFFPLLGQKQESAFTGKTEQPQWVDPDEQEMLNKLASQGVSEITWESGSNPCRMCLMNDKVTVKIGDPFPSGHKSPLCHPNCDCTLKELKSPVQEQEDKDATQKLPVVKVRKPNA